MKKLLLITTALVGIGYAKPAEAAPIGAWVAGAVLGAGAVSTSLAFVAISTAVQIGGSLLLSAVAMRLAGQPKQQGMRAELKRITSLPEYRFVYGVTRAPGTPVAMTVRGRNLYICWLLNSRPSDSIARIYLDERLVETSGNLNTTSYEGAVATNGIFAKGGEHARFWLGRGGQTQCPQMLVDETGGYFRTTDAWEGRTVLWARLRYGSDDDARERWPQGIPSLDVDGRWSLVRDPRAGGARSFSRNLGLILLDALRENPMQPYGEQYLRVDTFNWLADVSEERVGTRDGGTIPRYLADGILWFRDGQELEDILQPIADAGAAQFTRIGGRLGVIPAVARNSVYTVRDITDGRMPTFRRHRPSDDLFTEVMATYTDRTRSYEPAETSVYVEPGAQAADGGLPKRLAVNLDWITDHRQAQRVAKIMLRRSRAQREIEAELPPDAFDLVSGSAVSVDLGAPFGSWDGQYVVRSISPTAGVMDEDSITIRLPVTLAEDGPAIYDWRLADEQDSEGGGAIPVAGSVQPPAAVSIISGTAAADRSGDTVIPGVTAAWPASISASASAYEWEWRRRPAGATSWNAWRSGGVLDQSAADGVGVFSATIQFPRIGDSYQVRVKTRGTWGASGWRNSESIVAAGPAETLNAPPRPSATPMGSERIDVTATQTDDASARRLLIYGNDVDSAQTATVLFNPNAGPSVTVTRSETGLSAGQRRFYFARAQDQYGNLSDFSESRSAITS